MPDWPVSAAHADLIASAYVQLVDPTADPQDIGLAVLVDSLQGHQSREGGKFPREWQAVEGYDFRAASTPIDMRVIQTAMAAVWDTARDHTWWSDTDCCRILDQLRRRLVPNSAD